MVWHLSQPVRCLLCSANVRGSLVRPPETPEDDRITGSDRNKLRLDDRIFRGITVIALRLSHLRGYCEVVPKN